MTTTVNKQVLIQARALIASPAHWTRGTLACTQNNRPVDWRDPSAARWCALGAIYRAAFNLFGDSRTSAHIAEEVVKSVCPPSASVLRGYLSTVNDRQGHAAVLAAFDRALLAA